MTITQEIQTIFARRGGSAYYGEGVSVTEHALQAARLAQIAAAPAALVVAALLHDIGHLLADVPDDLDEWREDARHEETGGRWLAARFPPTVAEPVRLHVPAKRFLCATDPKYFSKLSPASVLTLELQGGPMTTSEVGRFRAEPYHREAVQVRQWDDEAKVVGLVAPHIADYGAQIEVLHGEHRKLI
jgi:phosphonate degradation associated HDIG domain protein